MASTEEAAPIISSAEETSNQITPGTGGGSPTTTAGSVSPRKGSRSAAGTATSTKGSRSTRESKRNKENVQPSGEKKKKSSKHAPTTEAPPVVTTTTTTSAESPRPTLPQGDEVMVEQQPLTPSAHPDGAEAGEIVETPQAGGVDNNYEQKDTLKSAPSKSEGDMAMTTNASGSQGVRQSKSSKPKSPSKQVSPETAQLKAKIAALISKSFAGSAYEVFAGTTSDSLESCFPTVSLSEGLKPGSEVIPGNEALPAVLNKLDLSTQSEGDATKDMKNFQEYLRDITLAGAFIGSSEILEECLKKGADLSMADPSGRNIFHVLATTGNAPLLRKVLRRLEKTHSSPTPASANKGDLSQRSGTKKGKRPPIEVANSFSDVINAADKRGWTPLLVAVCRNNVDAAEALLSHPQLNLECWLAHNCPPSQHSGDCKSCPIHFAAIQGSANLVKRLLVCGVSIDLRDTMGRNIFHYAAALRDKNLSAEFLSSLQEEPQFDKSLLLTPDAHGRSPIFVAVAWGNLAFLEAALRLVLGTSSGSTATTSAGQSAETGDKPEEDGAAAMASTEATKNTEEEGGSNSLTLTKLTLKPDLFALSAVQIAFLRRHYHVIFWLSQMWNQFKVLKGPEPDLPTFAEALRSSAAPRFTPPQDENPNAPPPSPSRILIHMMADQSFFSKPLEKDLSALEMSTFRVLQASLASDRYPALHPTKLMRAVRAAGPEMCLRCLTRALEIEREGGLVVNHRKFTNEGAFFHYLREQMEKELSEATATFNWRFIHVEEHYAKQGAKERRRSASVNSHMSHSETYSVPIHTSPSPSPGTAGRGANRRQIVPHPAGRPNAARSSSLTEPRATRFGAMNRSTLAGKAPEPTFTSPRTGSTSGPSGGQRMTGAQAMSRSVVAGGRTGPPPSPVTRSVIGGGENWDNRSRMSPNLSRSIAAPRAGNANPLGMSQRFAAPTLSTLQNTRAGPSSQSPIMNRSQAVGGPRGSASTATRTERRPPPPANAAAGAHKAPRHIPPPAPSSGPGRPIFNQQISSLEEDEKDSVPNKDIDSKENVMEHDRQSSIEDEDDEDISFEDQDF